MFRSVLFLLASLLATVAIAKSDLQSITYLTEEYPPYNFTENGELHGIAVDLLVAATARATQPVAKEDISVQPWARAYRTVLINKDTVLFFDHTHQIERELVQLGRADQCHSHCCYG